MTGGKRSCPGPAGQHSLILPDPGATKKVTGGGGHLAALNEIVAPSPEPHRLWGGRAHGMMNLPVTLADELSQIS